MLLKKWFVHHDVMESAHSQTCQENASSTGIALRSDVKITGIR